MSDAENVLDTNVNPDSILQSVKKNLGLTPEHTEFDPDIILHINSCLSKLTQLGIGPKNTVFITDDNDTWSLLYSDPKYNMIRTYIYLSVRLLFDPPSTTTMYEAFQRKIEELEWRLYMLFDESEIENDTVQ